MFESPFLLFLFGMTIFILCLIPVSAFLGVVISPAYLNQQKHKEIYQILKHRSLALAISMSLTFAIATFFGSVLYIIMLIMFGVARFNEFTLFLFIQFLAILIFGIPSSLLAIWVAGEFIRIARIE